MTRYFIVRHGETAWNAQGRIQGHLDVELTEKGIYQARCAANRLRNEKIDAVYASDLKRASVTGEIIASPHKLHVKTTPLLREACLGDWQGFTTAEISEKFPEEYALYSKDSIHNRPPNGERLEDVIIRCKRFLDEVNSTHPHHTVVVACHGGTVRGLVAAAFGMGPEMYRRIRVDNGGITILEMSHSIPFLATFNDTCHMAETGIGDGADR